MEGLMSYSGRLHSYARMVKENAYKANQLSLLLTYYPFLFFTSYLALFHLLPGGGKSTPSSAASAHGATTKTSTHRPATATHGT